MKIKSKILFLIGLILLFCSSSIFAYTVPNGTTATSNLYLATNSSNTNTANISLNLPSAYKSYYVTLSGTSLFVGTPDSNYWANASNGTSKTYLLLDSGMNNLLVQDLDGAGGTITINENDGNTDSPTKGSDFEYVITVDTSNYSAKTGDVPDLTFTSRLTGNSKINLNNLSASNAGQSVTITPRSQSTAINGSFQYAFNSSVLQMADSGSGYDYRNNIGSLRANNTGSYPTATFTLAEEDELGAVTPANKVAICTTYEYVSGGVTNFYTYTPDVKVDLANVVPMQLVINPVITGLQIADDDAGGNNYVYQPGTTGYAATGRTIYLFNVDGSTAPSTTAVLNYGNGANDPYLVVELTGPFSNITATTNNFEYDELSNLSDLQAELAEDITFVSSNPAVASLSGNGPTTRVTFGRVPGTAQIYATAPNNISSLDQTSSENRAVYVQIPASVVDITGISFENQNLTVTNYETAQDQILNPGMMVTPANGEIPEISNLKFSIVSTTDSNIKANWNGSSYVSSGSSTSLSGFGFEQGVYEVQTDGTVSIGPDKDGVQAGYPVYLTYSGSPEAEAGTYLVTVSYENQAGQVVTGSFNLTVTDSEEEPEVTIIYNGEPVGNGIIVDQTTLTNNTIQLGYETQNITDTQDVVFTLVNASDPEIQNKVVLNPDTGLLRLLEPLGVGETIQVIATVSGISSEVANITISGTPKTSGLGIVQNTINLKSGSINANSYNVTSNLTLNGQSFSDASGNPSDYNFTVTNIRPALSKDQTLEINGTGTITLPSANWTGSFTVNVEPYSGLTEGVSYNIVIKQELVAKNITVTPEMTLTSSNMQQGQISYTLTPNGSTSQGAWSFASDDDNIAYVNPATGLVTAISPGTTTVTTTWTASDGTPGSPFKATTTINVIDEEAQSISVEPSTLSLSIAEGGNNTGTLTATVVPASMADDVTWTSENTAIASVQGDGSTAIVTAQSVGTTTIVAEVGGVSDTVEITVTDNLTPTSFTVSPTTVNLTTLTGTGYINSQQLTVTLQPEGTTANITYETSTPGVAQVSNTGLITATGTGEAEITVTVGDLEPQYVTVYVNDDPVVCDDIIVTSQTPDYYTLTAKNVRPNPAMNASGTVQQVAMFTWSTVGSNGVQNDMQCKQATAVGNGDWSWSDFSVNDTYAYYNHADNIIINVYGSLVAGQNGNFMAAEYYKSVNNMNAQGYNDAYIAYCQDIGFDKPSILSGNTTSLDVTDPSTYSGTVGESRQMEGVRISSNIEGVAVTTQVHVENIGWQDPVLDGQYAGTMHRNLQIESMNLGLTGLNSSQYTIQYRVHQQNIGWSAWVSGGTEAGVTGQHLQLEAYQVRIVPVGTPLPTN